MRDIKSQKVKVAGIDLVGRAMPAIFFVGRAVPATPPMSRKNDLTSSLMRFILWEYCSDLIVNS
jgi:hypothetical protein